MIDIGTNLLLVAFLFVLSGRMALMLNDIARRIRVMSQIQPAGEPHRVASGRLGRA
jgi:hypothetical protein